MKNFIVCRFWDQNCLSGANGGTSYLGMVDDPSEVNLYIDEAWSGDWKETESGFERNYHSTINSEFGTYYLVKAGFEGTVNLGGICVW